MMKKWFCWIRSQKQTKNTNVTPTFDKSTSEIYEFQIKNYQEVVYVAKIFLEKKVVVIDLTKTEKMERRRIIDFFAGIIYVKQGQMKLKSSHRYELKIN